MKVYIPEDALDPTNTEFMRDLEGFVEEVIKSTKGHCFLLFTSYSTLNFLYSRLKTRFSQKEYTLIRQNDFPRHEMIEIFLNDNITDNTMFKSTDSQLFKEKSREYLDYQYDIRKLTKSFS